MRHKGIMNSNSGATLLSTLQKATGSPEYSCPFFSGACNDALGQRQELQ